jgi:hypothetical protein
MRRMTSRLLTVAALLGLAACGSGNNITPPPGKPALDPFLTVRIRDQLDTTKAAGKADWQLYYLLTGPEINQNGIGGLGSLNFTDVRLNHAQRCLQVRADSVGQRFLAIVALADTVVGHHTPSARADSMANAWYNGSPRTLPTGWQALVTASRDAWDSNQFRAGRGLTASDPIRWGWDWTASGTTTFYERDVSDTGYCDIVQ